MQSMVFHPIIGVPNETATKYAADASFVGVLVFVAFPILAYAPADLVNSETFYLLRG